jgi:hypothetical protein
MARQPSDIRCEVLLKPDHPDELVIAAILRSGRASTIMRDALRLYVFDDLASPTLRSDVHHYRDHLLQLHKEGLSL